MNDSRKYDKITTGLDNFWTNPSLLTCKNKNSTIASSCNVQEVHPTSGFSFLKLRSYIQLVLRSKGQIVVVATQ